MTNLKAVLVDHYIDWSNLRPLTLTRPISHLRIGILRIFEKWELYLKESVGVKTCADYLGHFNSEASAPELYISSCVLPSEAIVQAVLKLKSGETLYSNGKTIASKAGGSGAFETEVHYEGEVHFIHYPWDIFALNDVAIEFDFKLLTSNKQSEQLSDTNIVLGDKNRIFLEEGAKVEAAILNPSNGYIYIGANAEIMEGSVVRGSLAMCDSSTLKLSTKIYGATTVGPHCKIGGEVNNSVIQGYSNKGHDGFLGNSVIGEWCNLGADTNNSNLKNNYGEVKVWNYEQKALISTKRQFVGLIMGDHSKCGINTMFNTGTMVGVFANIFGGDFPPKLIPSFAWGGAAGFSQYDWNKAVEVAQRVMERRKVALDEDSKAMLNHIFNNVKEKL